MRPRKRLIPILALLVAFGLMAVPRSEANETIRPNVLWIIAENFDQDFGCYGGEHVSTPHVDSLARRGLRYTRCFATSPVCAPSRSCFMTGMYATTTDTHHMRSHRDDNYRLPEGVRPITQRFANAGYLTANITRIGDRVVGTGKLDLNFVNEGPIYQTDDWSALKSNQPFFAHINLPEAEYDIYDRKTAEKDRVVWVGEEWHPQIASEQNVIPPPYYPDHPMVRQEWARYLNSVSGADVRVGWILEALKRDGLDENTIVIFFADNGRLEPRGIHWCFDSGLRVPLIVAWPSRIPPPADYRAGGVEDRLVSLLDLTATTLSFASIDRPLTMQSRVFLGDPVALPRTYVFSARDRIDETSVHQRSVRGERYHYIRTSTPGAGFLTLNRYKEKCFPIMPLMRSLHTEGKLSGPAADLMKPFSPEMLFDTEADPFEIDNLVNSDSPEHQEVLARMRDALDVWMVETGDRGFVPEPEGTIPAFTREMHDWFGTPDWVVPR